jgi:nucleoid-associated protein YgaU
MLPQSRKGQEAMRRIGVGALIFLAGASPASAATLEQSLVTCSAKADNEVRLRCYDDVAKGLSAEARKVAEAREAEVVAAAAAATAAAAAKAEAERKAAFGKEGMGGSADAGEAQQIEAGVSELLRDAAGKTIFVLDNGQMWRQADAFSVPAKVGSKVIVKRGSLGSYRLFLAGSNRSAQVIRMR